MKNLKKIFGVIGLLLVTFPIKAQEIIKPVEDLLRDNTSEHPNTYYKDTNNKLQNLVGTWVYDNGTDYFKITFYKEKVIENEYDNVFEDRLFTKFLYKKNGRIIYDNYGTNSYPLNQGLVNTKPSKIQSSFIKNWTIGFIYTEPSTNDCHRRKIGSLDIIYTNDNPPKLSWKRTTATRYFDDMLCDNGIEPDNSDFVIPEDMVLTKLQ